MTNAQVALFLKEVAKTYVGGGVNQYKKRAHEKAAENVLIWPIEITKTAANGSLTLIPGVGESISRKIDTFLRLREYQGITLQSLETIKRRFKREELEEIIDYILFQFEPETFEFEIAGSWRRQKETVGDLDVVICCDEPIRLMTTFKDDSNIEKVLSFGPSATSVLFKDIGIQLDIRIVPKDSFGACLLFFTGSPGFNIQMRSRAKKQKKKLNRYGVFVGEKKIAGETEKEIFDELGMMFVDPQFREAELLDWS